MNFAKTVFFTWFLEHVKQKQKTKSCEFRVKFTGVIIPLFIFTFFAKVNFEFRLSTKLVIRVTEIEISVKSTVQINILGLKGRKGPKIPKRPN